MVCLRRLKYPDEAEADIEGNIDDRDMCFVYFATSTNRIVRRIDISHVEIYSPVLEHCNRRAKAASAGCNYFVSLRECTTITSIIGVASSFGTSPWTCE